MKLTSWDIKGFGKFKNYKANPGPGFNLIYAPNESGKSTLQAFIRAMLYGLKGGRKAKDGSLPPLKQFKPWNGEGYAGVLEYVLYSGEAFRVGRNFDKGTTHIYDRGANPIGSMFAQDRDCGPKFAEEHLGLDEQTFERSAFIRQMQCAVDETGRRTLIERLSNLSATGSEDQSLSKAIQVLETALLERVGTGRSSSRPLDRVNSRLRELEDKRLELIALNEHYLDSFGELHEKKGLLARWLTEREVKLEKLSKVQKAKLSTLKREMEAVTLDLEERGKELQTVHQAIQGIEAYSSVTTEGLTQATVLYHDMNRIKQALLKNEHSLETLNVEKEKLEASLDKEEIFLRKTQEIEEILKSSSSGAPLNRPTKKVSILVYPAILLAVASVFLWFQFRNPGMLVLALLGVVLAGFFFIKNSIGKTGNPSATLYTQSLNKALSGAGFLSLSEYFEYKEEQQKGRSSIEGLDQKLSETTQQYRGLKDMLCSLEDQWRDLTAAWPLLGEEDKGTCVDIWRNRLEKVTQLATHKKEIVDRMSYLTDKRGGIVREASNLLEKPGLTYEECEKVLCHIKDDRDVELLDETALSRELQALDEQIGNLRLEITALATRLERVPQEGEITRIVEEITSLEEKKLNLERVGSSLELAGKILSETAACLQKDYIPVLNEKMSAFLSLLTSGRYTRASTNDALQVLLAAPETDELITADRLSGGTIDQIYLAMRLAAVTLLEKREEPLPLFLDEPFSQYDEERLCNGFSLLKELSRDRQIFFFTCRERELKLAQDYFDENMVQIRL